MLFEIVVEVGADFVVDVEDAEVVERATFHPIMATAFKLVGLVMVNVAEVHESSVA